MGPVRHRLINLLSIVVVLQLAVALVNRSLLPGRLPSVNVASDVLTYKLPSA